MNKYDTKGLQQAGILLLQLAGFIWVWHIMSIDEAGTVTNGLLLKRIDSLMLMVAAMLLWGVKKNDG